MFFFQFKTCFNLECKWNIFFRVHILRVENPLKRDNETSEQ